MADLATDKAYGVGPKYPAPQPAAEQGERSVECMADLRQQFRNRSDCYVWGDDDTHPAMTEDRFVEVVAGIAAKQQHGASGMCCQLREQERRRADTLQQRLAAAENALRPLIAHCTLPRLTEMGNQTKRLEWLSELRPLVAAAQSILTPRRRRK